ncbi:unnamed protein product [Paramecium sonneborni]|uniref:Calcineurin-like phosphoesterase domain-containing protein n=1 Tax=Paramecium sonneborni TaxID=65129 RepID=A0A8S1L6M5_9CILI|nr:unnamed protein product [Paramecium sonneborni]
MIKNIVFVCISDTHGLLGTSPDKNASKSIMPKGDVLIHCGDFTNYGEIEGIRKFKKWLIEQPFKHKILIAGNHDRSFDQIKYPQLYNQMKEEIEDLKNQCHYLYNNSCIIEGYKIWGSPYSLEFCNWAFQLDPRNAKQFWNQIEEGTDIVVTHGPSYGHGDLVDNSGNVGDIELLNKIKQIKPKYHLFGHIHEGYGITEEKVDENIIKFVNCSSLNEYYKITNLPYIFELPQKQNIDI